MKVPLCKLEELPEEGTKTIDFFGRELLLLKVDGEPKAIVNICMHLGGPMRRAGNKLTCEWHGAVFDCMRGNRLKGPARQDSRRIMRHPFQRTSTVNPARGRGTLRTNFV